jgi:hypothetical protein
MQKDKLSAEVMERVDWDAIERAMNESKWGKRTFISKHACGMCGVGRFMKLWKLRQDDLCP